MTSVGGSRRSVLIVHSESHTLDELTWLLSHQGYEVSVAATAITADAQIDSHQFNCIVCGWESVRAAPLFARAVLRAPILADRFVFYGYEAPEMYFRATGARCEVVDASAPDAKELLLDAVRAATGVGHEDGGNSLVEHRLGGNPDALDGTSALDSGIEAIDNALDDALGDVLGDGPPMPAPLPPVPAPLPPGDIDGDSDAAPPLVLIADEPEDIHVDDDELAYVDVELPSLLLVDDDALELRAMERFLVDYGFDVSVADGYQMALKALADEDFDVILSDWYLADGLGADILVWAGENKPHLMQRVVFVSATEPKELPQSAAGRPFFPKGQDSDQLMRMLVDLCRRQNKPLPAGADS